MGQMTLSVGDRIDCIFSQGIRCKYLKSTPWTGQEIHDHDKVRTIMGYCRYLGGDAYDGSCRGCTAYQPKDERRS